jgi:hypothetical protein
MKPNGKEAMTDFGHWDNEPPQRSHHVTPPDVERILRSGERRQRRKQLLIVISLLLFSIFALWEMLKGASQ